MSSDWIEINDCDVRLYLNVRTGQCQWTDPSARAMRVQWWQLYDTHSQRFYYYCCATRATQWKRPPNVPIVELAQLQRNLTARATQSTQTEPIVAERATQTRDSDSDSRDEYSASNGSVDSDSSFNIQSDDDYDDETTPADGGCGGDGDALAQQPDNLETFAREHVHRAKRGFFHRKCSLRSMIQWTKQSIRSPMIANILQKSDAIGCFKLIQQFMGDYSARNDVSRDEIAFQLILKSFQMRDEFFVQIARQTNHNPNPESLNFGLKLLSIVLWFFPPSDKLSPHIRAHLQAHAPTNAYAQLALRKLSHRVTRRPSSLDDVRHVRLALEQNRCGVYGEPIQSAVKKGRFIPWTVPLLAEAILRVSPEEGLFRVGGDYDTIQRIRFQLDTHTDTDDDPIIDPETDVHALCSALKLYFRELPNPLLPRSALNTIDNACAVVQSLPLLERNTVGYLIRFLQVFSAHAHVTKMDAANLSCVFAPNLFVPLQLTDATILEETRKEMNFLKNLIIHLNTAFVSGL